MLSKKKIEDIVKRHGLQKAILERVEPVEVQDPELRRLWSRAKSALESIQEYLVDEPAPEEDDPFAGEATEDEDDEDDY